MAARNKFKKMLALVLAFALVFGTSEIFRNPEPFNTTPLTETLEPAEDNDSNE